MRKKVSRHSASTGQRRTFVVACASTLALRRLIALVLALTERQPLRAVSHSEPGGRRPEVPLAKLHTFAHSLCSVLEPESGKGVEQAVALGAQFLEQAAVRRALPG